MKVVLPATRGRLASWVLGPWLWIVLAPVVTVPLTWYLLGNLLTVGRCNPQAWWGAHCPTSQVLLTLIPGVLHLGAAGWLRVPHKDVQITAIVAFSVGLLRILTPALVYLSQGESVTVLRVRWLGVERFEAGPSWMWAVSAALWALSVVGLIATAFWMSHRLRRAAL